MHTTRKLTTNADCFTPAAEHGHVLRSPSQQSLHGVQTAHLTFAIFARQITRFLSGLVLAVDYQKGMAMIDERGYSEHEGFFQDVLEIARRHKIMNPEKMRTEYAKVGSVPDKGGFMGDELVVQLEHACSII